MENNTKTFEIYRDGKLSLKDTYGPILRDKLFTALNYVDQICAQSTFRPKV